MKEAVGAEAGGGWGRSGGGRGGERRISRKKLTIIFKNIY